MRHFPGIDRYPAMNSPIFFDASGRRRRLVGRISGLLLALTVIASAAFATTIVEVPQTAAIDFMREREQPLPFKTHLARLRHALPALPAFLRPDRPLTVGFYLPSDEESAHSLLAHYSALDWVVTGNATVDPQTASLHVASDPRLAAILRNHLHRPAVMMMVQNLASENWFAAPMVRILDDRQAGDRLIADTIAAAKHNRWQGAVFDIENLPDSATPAYQAFLARAHQQFHAAGLALSATVPAETSAADFRRFAEVTDHVILMDYDLHWQGGEPGAIAPQDWFVAQLDRAKAAVPAKKLIVALGSYAYDWHDGIADALTIDEAWLSAHDSGTRPTFDPVSGNSGFAFEDSGHKHTVWMLDATASWNELTALDGVGGVALWRLGSEDPGFWTALDAFHRGRTPDMRTIAPASGTDVEGSGEILRIGAEPRGGARTIHFASDHTIVGETYTALPTPYVVERTGAQDRKAIALTFDDGPDPDYTPRLLNILEAKHTPATFFMIGENALEHPEILRRIVADGDEIGNHSYTHPNLAQVSALGTTFELNATQRLIEAYTGHSTRLFRAPYFGDAEPSTADELKPAVQAQDRGYTIVGLHVDPGDWKRPGVDVIVNKTLQQVRDATAEHSGNIVLLHDGGGNRDQTVAALPRIIDGLRAEGYHFVPVSQLAGLSRAAVMPPVRGGDLLAVRGDVAFFVFLAMIEYAIRWTFFFAIALGISRAVLFTVLALLDRWGEKGAPRNPEQPPVSVIIPAYNEEKVIVASITRVLASDYPDLELIVADDGSKDATSALVAQHFGGDPRVRLLTLENGGKAGALNRALTHAKGAIIIALDADTHFLPQTISRLVGSFTDPRIGAVAGNARVGNQINLITRWQGIEYVTAQNVERRALDALGAITVVPGAVGAWRREALDAVGGYPEDTLAEDQDLTIAIQRKGWRVAYDVEALALTEAPETMGALAKQRFRWSFGTLQCLWKHRAALRSGKPRGLAWIGMPQAWLFQIVFAAVSPIIDFALVVSIIGTVVRVHQHGWAQTQSDVLRMGVYWFVFVAIDLLAGWIAYRMEPQRQRFPAFLMIAQRFVYRQLMYSVVLRSVRAAFVGRGVGWGKLERTGSVGSAATS